MPRAEGGNRILAFDVGDEYVFSHYFDHGGLFQQLSEYYDNDGYRFEVPPDEFGGVRELLAEVGYEVEVVENPEPYCVVVEEYAEHAAILRESVAHWTRRGHHFFLMCDEFAVEKALDRGATLVSETELVAGI